MLARAKNGTARVSATPKRHARADPRRQRPGRAHRGAPTPAVHPMTQVHPMERCKANSRSGQRCANRSMRGQQVCHMHGGKSPQALAKAEDRLRDLVHPAISRLAQLIDSAESDAVKLAAVRDVLDRAGYKAPDKLQADHDITIEIVRKSSASAFALKPPNGHTNGRAD